MRVRDSVRLRFDQQLAAGNFSPGRIAYQSRDKRPRQSNKCWNVASTGPHLQTMTVVTPRAGRAAGTLRANATTRTFQAGEYVTQSILPPLLGPRGLLGQRGDCRRS